MENKYLKTANILYVEDEKSIQEGFAKTLTRCAKELYIADNGQMGLELFKKNQIDIIVSDVKMPIMSGIDMAKEILEINPNIPIIFTTAHSESNMLLQAIELHVDGYLLKPVPIKKLIEKVNKISKNIFLEKTNKLQQQRLFKIEKMASMGEMIGNIAHQWRQPLSVISTAATSLKVQKEYNTLSDKFFFESCSLINDNAQYISKIIDDFDNILHHNDEMKVFNLKENIESFLKLVESDIKTNNVKIILNLQEDIEVDGYPNELIQCFINMFNNSKDALNLLDESNKLIFISTYINDKDILIKIKDNGGGIKNDLLSKVFEPYFTTKHQSQGTGLGLHMAYNLIVNGMDGDIDVQNISYEYEGTSFTGAEFTITLKTAN